MEWKLLKRIKAPHKKFDSHATMTPEQKIKRLDELMKPFRIFLHLTDIGPVLEGKKRDENLDQTIKRREEMWVNIDEINALLKNPL